MTVPFFRRRPLAMSQAVAMAVVLTLPISLAGMVGYVMSGWGVVDLPHYTLGYIYWPAVIGVVIGSLIGVPIGTKLVYQLSDTLLARSYFIVLILVMIV